MGGKNKNKGKRPRSPTNSPPLDRRAKTARAVTPPTPPLNLALPGTSGESTTSAQTPSPTPSSSGLPPAVLDKHILNDAASNLNTVSSHFETTNRFAALSSAPSGEENVQPKPPPIFISGVTDIGDMVSTLSSLLGPASFTYKSRSSDVALYPKSPEYYRKAVRHFKENNVAYYTYQLKEEKAYRVVIRNLHPSTPITTIKSELESKGFQVKNITGVKHRTTKEYLSLFFVDLEPHQNNKLIFELTELYYCKVTVEEPYKNHEIVQCKRCQALGHTRNHCNKPERCVKCAGNHATGSCSKKREDAPKCALCGGSHPASYRGCQVHTELQQKLRRTPKFTNIRGDNPTPSLRRPVQPSHNQNTRHQLPVSTQDEANRSTHLASEVTQGLSYASVTKNAPCFDEPHQSRPNHQPFIPPPSFSNDIVTALSSALTTALSSFLTQLQNAITPLVNLLSHVTTILPLHFPEK